MLDENYVTFEIGKTKHIALVAHDGKKKELVDWCESAAAAAPLLTATAASPPAKMLQAP